MLRILKFFLHYKNYQLDYSYFCGTNFIFLKVAFWKGSILSLFNEQTLLPAFLMAILIEEQSCEDLKYNNCRPLSTALMTSSSGQEFGLLKSLFRSPQFLTCHMDSSLLDSSSLDSLSLDSPSLNPAHCCFPELVKLKKGYEQGVVMNYPGMNKPAMNCPAMNCPSAF